MMGRRDEGKCVLLQQLTESLYVPVFIICCWQEKCACVRWHVDIGILCFYMFALYVCMLPGLRLCSQASTQCC